MMVEAIQAPPLRTIGRYHIVTKLADGVTGKVYEGFDPATDAPVAIKVLSRASARDPVLRRRFVREFRVANRLRHPHIVRGLEFGWDGPKPFVVLEWVDGEDLGTRIRDRGRLPHAEAVAYITQVARGLHEAHDHGIVHGNIKPDNVLLTTEGTAKLAGLGLGKDLEDDIELTRPRGSLSTPHFLAPEQFHDAKNSDVRGDIYALGATLYLAVTGRLPFDGANAAAILRRKIANDIAPPRTIVPQLREHVDWAICRAILADPDRRYASCLDFIAALSQPSGGAAGKGRGMSRRTIQKAKKPHQERRDSLRFDCALRTTCTINRSLHENEPDCQTSWDAEVRNLSTSGIGLLAARRFEPGSVLSLVLSNREGDVKRTCSIRVVRVGRARGQSWFLAGILTEKLSKEELRLLL